MDIHRAQPCMVIKVKDVGKLPHSRITTYGETHWHQGKKKYVNMILYTNKIYILLKTSFLGIHKADHMEKR